VEEVKALLADNEMRRMMMNDEQKRREFSASMDNDTKVKAEINAEIIQAKTGVELDPVSLEQDVINAQRHAGAERGNDTAGGNRVYCEIP
jgi:hypothetical protein